MKLSRILLSIGIALLFALFVGYALYVFYEPPKYYIEPGNCSIQYNCDNMTAMCYPEKNASSTEFPNPAYDACMTNIQQKPEYIQCMESRDKCDDAFIKTTQRYKNAQVSFFILIAIAILALIAGTFVINVEGVSSGLIGGGILTIIWSLIYTRVFWVTWGKYVKLLALFAVLVLLFYIGFKKFRK